MSSHKLFYITISTFLLLATTISCNASNQFLTKISVNNENLELSDKDGNCAVKYNQKLYPLNIQTPCGFVRVNKKMNAQKYHYKDIGTVFIIAGTAVAKNIYTEDDGVKSEHMCSNHGQAIIVNKGEIILRKEKMIKLGFCHQLGFDEKIFYGYAYPVD